MRNEESNSVGLLGVAILASISAILLSLRGIMICGWPPPDLELPQGSPRHSYATNEIRWRQLKARETNDASIWNEKAEFVLLLSGEERDAEQDEMIKRGLIPESSRLRPLSPIEQTEMERRVEHVRLANAAMDFGQVWAFFGVPLNLLAMLLTFLAFWRAYGRRNHSRQVIFVVLLFMMNCLSFVLTLRNASGTSFD